MQEGAATPGWYPDTTNDDRMRYWDGEAWTNRFADDEAVATGAGTAAARPAGISPSTAASPPRRRRLTAALAVIGWGLAVIFGALYIAAWNADTNAARVEQDDYQWAIANMCSRLTDDPTLLDDWRLAIDLDANVTGQLVNLTASEASVRPLASALRGLGPRLLALAGATTFESEDGWSQQQILGAAIYADRATRAIDAWDYSDTRYRILEGQMSGDFSTYSEGLGYTSVVDEIATACA